MQLNPFLRPIAKLLRSHAAPLSEYELLQQLAFTDNDLKLSSESSGDLALFRKHFLVMNALYQLQPIFKDEGFHLVISALKIELINCNQPSNDQSNLQEIIHQPGDEKIKAYYLNWDEFAQSDQESVETLLNSFWQRYFATDEEFSALNTLGLEEGSDWPTIRSRYRQLASQHHPDKGGKSARFIEIREAYELLACIKRPV